MSATPDTPTSYVVVNGPDGARAYFGDDSGALYGVAADAEGNFNFAAAQSGMIGLDLLAEPKLASPAGSAVSTLRQHLTALMKAKQAAQSTTAGQASLDEAA